MKNWIFLLTITYTCLGHAYECPQGNGASAGDQPKFVFNSLQGPTVTVCSDDFSEFAPGSGVYSGSEFDIYWQTESLSPKRIFAAGANDKYSMKVGKKDLALQQDVANGVAELTAKITCTKKSCALGKWTCEITSKKHPNPDALERIKDRMKTGRDDLSGEYEGLIVNLSSEAASGDKEAVQFLESKQLHEAVASNSAASEALNDGIGDLRQLKSLKCLK